MPELPEVEIVTNQLKDWAQGKVIVKMSKSRKALRFEKLSQKLTQLQNQKVQNIFRRGKYIVWNLGKTSVVSHLGMSGQWKILDGKSANQASKKKAKHSHIEIEFSDGQRIEYIDPRRFGFFVVIPTEKQVDFKLLKDLGVEPLSEEFTAEYLLSHFKNKVAPVKNIIMNQSVVVGVGNIYAVESLFLARINPLSRGKKVTKEQASALVEHIRGVLLKSIENGGSSIDDFVHVNGQSGSFQNLHLVYGRTGQNCVICATKIKSQFLAGRNTFWCPTCQKN